MHLSFDSLNWLRICHIMILKYTRCQITLYRMFFADFSDNSQPILMKFCKDYFRVTRRLPVHEIFIKKYIILFKS